MAETIKDIADQLSRIFRHMLPGLVVVGGAAAAHPSWFGRMQLSNPWHIATLGAITVAAGNVWYVFHRYTIYQLIDWFLYMIRERRLRGYLDWLSNFLDNSFSFAASKPKIHEHLHFRSSQIILMFIVGEVMVLFSIRPECHSFFADNKPWPCLVGVAMFIPSIWQYVISNTLDFNAVTRWSTEKTRTAGDATTR
jgi:hypothetical protein